MTATDINATSAPIMPSVKELHRHGTSPIGERRFRLVGGDLAPDWVQYRTQRRPEPGRHEEAWCEVTVHPDGFIGSYGGAVWPSAWPELFAPIPPSAAYGSGGFRLTLKGRIHLGLPIDATTSRAELYADMAELASSGGSHDLAADMYMCAAECCLKMAVDGYVAKANEERAKAQGARKNGGAL